MITRLDITLGLCDVSVHCYFILLAILIDLCGSLITLRFGVLVGCATDYGVCSCIRCHMSICGCFLSKSGSILEKLGIKHIVLMDFAT